MFLKKFITRILAWLLPIRKVFFPYEELIFKLRSSGDYIYIYISKARNQTAQARGPATGLAVRSIGVHAVLPHHRLT